MSVCVVPDCGKKMNAKGYCGKHYYQVRKFGHVVKTWYDEHDFQIEGDVASFDVKGIRFRFDACLLDEVRKYHFGIRRLIRKDGQERFYAWTGAGKGQRYLHEIVMGSKAPSGMVTDHRDRDSTNNCRSNLRFVTRKENNLNVGPRSSNTSGVVGVTLDRKKQTWRAYFKRDGKRRERNGLATREEAIRVRQEFEREYADEHL